MTFYYSENNEKRGPLNLEELKVIGIRAETLIWHKGLDKWKMAKNIPELQSILKNQQHKKYYLLEGNNKIGPFDFDDLKNKGIQPSTLVWYNELDRWTEAKHIQVLEAAIMPLLPDNIKTSENNNEVIIVNKIHDEQNNNLSNDNSKKDKTIITRSTPFNSDSFFQRPFSAKGRIGRMEYFVILLMCYFLYFFVASLSEGVYSDAALVFYIVLELFIIYIIIVNTAKRSHDIGNSGWWQLIPFYGLYILFAPGEDKINKYGNKP